jgi:GT2 family glycosyltransferase
LAAAKGALVGKAKVHRKDYLTRLENVKLHGCFLVFSQTYIQQFDGLDPSTFLYWEEELLYLHMQMRGLKTVYRPDILVYHMEDAATDAYFPAARDKKIFVLTHYLDSLEQLKILYQTYEEQKRKEGFDA